MGRRVKTCLSDHALASVGFKKLFHCENQFDCNAVDCISQQEKNYLKSQTPQGFLQKTQLYRFDRHRIVVARIRLIDTPIYRPLAQRGFRGWVQFARFHFAR